MRRIRAVLILNAGCGGRLRRPAAKKWSILSAVWPRDVICILEMKQEWPEITLEAAVPCPTQTDGWSAPEQARWRRLLERCDYETMVQDHYSPGCMMRRNRYMVDHAAMLIAVYDGQGGGTRRTVEYALRRGVPVVCVPPVEEE